MTTTDRDPKIESLISSFQELVETFYRIATIAPKIEALGRNAKTAIARTVEQGWFFGWHGSLEDVMVLVDQINGCDHDGIDDLMASYYRREISGMVASLLKKYPDRMGPIQAAAFAHEQIADHGYWLSVPVFLAQADGILSELSKNAKALKSPRKLFADQISRSEDTRDLLHALHALQTSWLLASPDARRAMEANGKRPIIDLNRHVVAHGLTSDYGSEVHSLKAFSFLAYVGLHIPLVVKG